MQKLLFASLLLLSFATSSRSQWGPESKISTGSDTAYISYGHAWSLASDGDTVYAVWRDDRPGNDVYFNRSTDNGATWEGAQNISDDTAGSWNPAIAVSAHIIHITWINNRISNFNTEVSYRRSTDGGTTWSSESSISPGGSAGDPSLVATGMDVHASWTDYRHLNNEIYYNRSSDGGLTWGTADRLTNDLYNSYMPSIALSGNYVYMVWSSYRDSLWEIDCMVSSDGGGSWGVEKRLTDEGVMSGLPSVAAIGSTVHVTWYQGIEDQDLFAIRSTDRGVTWFPAVNLSNDSTPAHSGCITAAGPNLHLVWGGIVDSTANFGIFYAISRDLGATWSPKIPIVSNPAAVYSPTISVSGTTVHAAWIDKREGSYQIYYKRDPTGNLPTVGLELDPGWNLVSIPFVLPDYATAALFPGAMTGAYYFEGTYMTAETLMTGRGYWIKCPAVFVAAMSGPEVLIDTIDVANGWNLIGSIGVPVDAAAVVSSPPAMTVSPFHGYSGGYSQANQLLPGEGYWVKTDSGQLILSSPALSQKTGLVRIVDTGELPPPSPGGSGSTDVRVSAGASRIEGAFPNPFNPRTKVYYTLSHDAFVDLKIINVLGEVMATLVGEKLTAGVHSSVWDAEGVPSGIYFCRLMVGNEIRTTKLLKLQ